MDFQTNKNVNISILKRNYKIRIISIYIQLLYIYIKI